MKHLKSWIQNYRYSEYIRLSNQFGNIEGKFLDKVLKQNRSQLCILFLGTSILIGLFADQWLITIFAVILMPIVFIGYTKYYFEDLKKARQTQWQMLMPKLTRTFAIAICSGMHPKNALVDVFSSSKSRTLVGEDVSLTLRQIHQGTLLESVLLQLSFRVNHPSLTKLCRLIMQFEKTGNPLVLFHLEQLIEEVVFQKDSAFKVRIETADLFSLLPIGLNFLILMILLMSPIFLGGLKL